MPKTKSKAPNVTLKNQQLAAANFLLSGMEQKEAYLAANYKAKDAAQAACNLFNNPKVKAYLDAMRSKSITKTIATREQKRKVLWDAATRAMDPEPILHQGIDTGLTQFRGQTAVSAVAELNKMDGHHTPVKVEQSGTITHEHRSIPEIDQIIGDKLKS